MPFLLYLLGLAVFAQATSEFMLSGLGPDISHDLGVPLPATGWLTSAFAIGMVVGAPAIAVLGSRWPRRPALLITLSVFLVVHVLGALTTSFTILLLTRIVAAVANAAFLALALTTATTLVRPDAKGRATAILLSGTTLACIAGVPGGALLGQYYGWRSAFWAVAAICLPTLIAAAYQLPSTPPTPSPPRRRGLIGKGLVLRLSLGALVNGATFCSFVYLAPVITETANFGADWVPVMLALFGIGSFAGVTVAGRLADRSPLRVLAVGGTTLLVGWCAFGLLAAVPAAVVVLVLVQGALSFAVGSTLIALALYAAADLGVLGAGLATAALNVGAAIGPVLGGLAIAGFGFRAPLWVSAALVAAAAGLVLLTARSTGFAAGDGHPRDPVSGSR
ncbi:Cmx/CmrA family chloramphenicol efflux MFS transporter [Kribbella sp. CA-294648]|uniref:Cmx/CmrA family chloramphenicol efflux MFS transporter n=1 Tax=Kribbella sp. CA-294648 TaxID=3239948 RepID=UPI003D92C894